MNIFRCIAAVFVLAFASSAYAQTRTVVADVGTLQMAPASPGQFLTITCYYNGTVANNICAGGGDFDRAASCGTDTDNGATILQDSLAAGQNCYYRKNFGLNGVADARQCGVVGDGADHLIPDGDRINNCLLIAVALGIHVVNTGGGVVLDNTANITIPQNTELSCGGNSTATDDNDDYRILDGSGNPHLTNAIVLDPRYSIVMGANNSSFTNCTLEAGLGASSNPNPNIYSPSTYYPNCRDTLIPCTTAASRIQRSAINEYSAFNPLLSAQYAANSAPAAGSVGISLTTAENLAVRNVTVLGFGTCYKAASGPRRLYLDRFMADCDVGLNLDGLSDSTQFNAFEVKPFLTRAASVVLSRIDALTFASGTYTVVAEVGTMPNAFKFMNNDTVWLDVGNNRHAESASGRWIIGNVTTVTTSPCLTGSCQSFTLTGSTSSTTVTAAVNNVVANGIPANAVVGTSPPLFKLVSVGQSVSDSTGAGCIPGGTTVVDVWPAQGIAYLSATPTCAAASDTVKFSDNAFVIAPNCTNLGPGCVVLDTSFRFGDGVVATNSGGVTAVNCTSYDHTVSFHMSTNANSARFANCQTGENTGLPDGDIVGLKIDGDHTSSFLDACGIDWVNGEMGQHRQVSVLIQSDCTTPDRLVNLGTSSSGAGRRNGVEVELDGGTAVLVNNSGGGPANVFKADTTQFYDSAGNPVGTPATAVLNMSNNSFAGANLYLEDSAAAASTSGCGNVFAVSTAWLCPPPLAELIPGGRLTLCASPPCPAVMTQGIANASSVYYVPYTGQQVPIHDPQSGHFGKVDIGSGLTLALDSTAQTASNLYDIFVETVRTGSPELCTGPHWSNSGAGTSARAAALTQIDGVWVNAAALSACHVTTSTDAVCVPASCTYLGTMFMTASGQTTQQIGQIASLGSSGNCLCLFNGYNRVPLVAQWLDLGVAYNYGTATWRSARGTTNERITAVDGLAQVSINATLNDAVNKNGGAGGAGAIGLSLNSTSTAPSFIAQTDTTTHGSYQAVLTNPPVLGLWYVQAMENDPGALNATFGGSNFGQIGVEIDD